VGAVVLRHLLYIHYSLSVGTHIRHSGLDSVSASAGMLLLHSVFETQGVLGIFPNWKSLFYRIYIHRSRVCLSVCENVCSHNLSVCENACSQVWEHACSYSLSISQSVSLTICRSVRIIALDFFCQSVRTLVLKSVFQCVRIIFLESVEINR
jgi:hypothetical protein